MSIYTGLSDHMLRALTVDVHGDFCLAEHAMDVGQSDVLDTSTEYVPADPRLQVLSAETRAAIDRWWGGSIDEAAFQAERRCNLFSHPGAWAIELVAAQKRGWK